MSINNNATEVEKIDTEYYTFSEVVWQDSSGVAITAERLNRYESALKALLPTSGSGYIATLTQTLNSEIDARTNDIDTLTNTVNNDISNLTEHIGTTTGNPHKVTKADLDLGNVENYSLTGIQKELTGSIENDNHKFITGHQIYNSAVPTAQLALRASTADKATSDGSGNEISTTYATQTALKDLRDAVKKHSDDLVAIYDEFEKDGYIQKLEERVGSLDTRVESVEGRSDIQNNVLYSQHVIIFCGDAASVAPKQSEQPEA